MKAKPHGQTVSTTLSSQSPIDRKAGSSVHQVSQSVSVETGDPLSLQLRDSISAKLQTTWEHYIDLIHRFISINISVIVAVAATVWFLPKLRPDGATSLSGKWL